MHDSVVEAQATVPDQARNALADLGVEHLRGVETDDRHRLPLLPLLEPHDLRPSWLLCHPHKYETNFGELLFYAVR